MAITDFGWMKRYTPRGLYGRAALILLLPIVTIQLLVGYAFVQRFYEDVTGQMTRAFSRPVVDLIERLDDAPNQAVAEAILSARAPALGLEASYGAPPVVPYRAIYDFSGRVAERVLRRNLPDLGPVDLGVGQRVVAMEVPTAHGTLRLDFSRRLVTPANPHQLLVLMVFAGVVLTAVSYVFLKNQLRPVHRLANAATAFGRGVIADYRPAGATEMRAAGQAFLDMRARIERATQQRTLMLSGVSHDLRTPLTRMRLALEMSDDPEAPDLLKDVAEMEAMIAAFLDFARAGTTGEPEPTDIVALVREVHANALRAGQDIVLPDWMPGILVVPVRRDAMQRALANLVGNAARYGTRGRLIFAVGEKSVTLGVEDDGPGIPAADREEATRPFVRLDTARGREGGRAGVGLGLAIAGDVARTHGGTLRLSDSEGLGGLKAEIVLPR